MTNAATITTSKTLYYYVSIPHYSHKVLKCQGICPDDAHKGFYKPYFEQHGPSVVKDTEHGPFHVEIMPYIADRISQSDDGQWEAFNKF